MEWHTILLILALFFYLLSAFQYLKLWKAFKELNIGDEMSKEFSDKSQQSIKIAIYALVLGSILSLIGVFLKPY